MSGFGSGGRPEDDMDGQGLYPDHSHDSVGPQRQLSHEVSTYRPRTRWIAVVALGALVLASAPVLLALILN